MLLRARDGWHVVWAAALTAVLIGCKGEVPEGNGTSDRGNQSAETKRIIILTNGSSPFWNAAALGAKNAAQEFKLREAGYEMVVHRNDFTVNAQIDKLKQYTGSTDVAAVAISVIDDGSRAIVDEMRRLQEAGIKVITIDSDVDRETARDARFAYLGTDNVVAGRELGRAAKALKPGGAKYAAFVGLKGASNAKGRIRGFEEATGESFERLEYLGDGGPGLRDRKNVRDALDRHSDIDLLLGIWSYNTPAIIDIVTQLEVRDKVTVVGFDADPPSILGMEDGNLDVMIVQNPYQMGYQGVRLLKALLDDDQAVIDEMLPNHGDEGGDLYDTGLKIIVPNEQSPVKADLFESNTEFLTLETFKQWLRKYGLKGS